MDFLKNAVKNMTPRRVSAAIIGNIIIGLGVALLRLSGMGNDPFNAQTMAISTGLGIPLGNYQLALNVVLLLFQISFGRKYIGLGTLINMAALGYIVQLFIWVIWDNLGISEDFPIYVGILLMLASILLISFGLSMYQCADLGVAPFDYLSLAMTEKLPIPYKINRIITDSSCVVVILLARLGGLIGWKDCHLGVATIIVAFCLGPFIDFFSRFNKKWIIPEKNNA